MGPHQPVLWGDAGASCCAILSDIGKGIVDAVVYENIRRGEAAYEAATKEGEFFEAARQSGIVATRVVTTAILVGALVKVGARIGVAAFKSISKALDEFKLDVPDKTPSPIQPNSVSVEDIKFYGDDDMALQNSWTPDPHRNLNPHGSAGRHYNEHIGEFPELRSFNEYVEATHNFLTKPPSGTQSVMRNKGDIIRYHPETNTFGVLRSDGTPRTMFRPSGAKYWQKQVEAALNGGGNRL